jgi:hypothetical protein
MRLVVMAAIAMVGITSPAVAADPATASGPEDKVICKRVQETSTGSHFPVTRRTCMKRSEWKELADDTDRTLRNVNNPRLDPKAAPAGMGGTPQ